MSANLARLLAGVSVIALLIAIPTFVPYAYYQYLKILVTASAFLILNTSAIEYPGTVGLALFVAIFIFFPLGVAELPKTTWVIIDIFYAFIFGFIAVEQWLPYTEVGEYEDR